MQTVAIVDFSFGNLRSVFNALTRLAGSRFKIKIATRSEEINAADRVVFPGQGAARHCMQSLQTKELVGTILEAARERPFLGICMGMHVLMEHSEENDGINCLGLVSGQVQPFQKHVTPHDGVKIPHMGWSRIHQTTHPLWAGIPDHSRFYFVHSYYVAPKEKTAVVGRTDYAIEFASAIAQGPAFALQCHPEKSSTHGLRFLENFLSWNGQSPSH